MAKPGQTLENPITGERITFRTTIQNSDGKQWEAELSIPLQFAMIVKAMQPIGYMAGMPIPVQHILFGVLSGLGRLLGYSLEIPQRSA